ncbi:MAG: ferredoxin--NADP reductase [Magnetococcales bacterium]|nr:ferredoxin--NADP reductase [Magnetococcales bacterium]
MADAPHESSHYNATVIKRIDITPQLAIFQVRPDDNNLAFIPGQFTVLGLTREAPRVPEAGPGDPYPPEKAGRLIRRAYSISSGSEEKAFLEFYVSMVTSGELTPRIFALQEGSRLFVGKKASGVFTLDSVPQDKNILLVGTGTGLAPYISMVRTLALGIGCPIRPLAVLHGASYSWDLGYRGELEGLSRQCPKFGYIPVISRPQEDGDWNGRTGRLNDWITHPELPDACGFDLSPEQTHVFLCGNPGMVENAAAQLQEKGFDPGSRKEPGNLHLEKYW